MGAEYELTKRGNESFPFEYYYLDHLHPRYVMPYHWHMDYELIRVIDGTLPLSVGSMRLSLSDGDCVIVPPGAIHGSFPPSGVYECVVFDISRLFSEMSVNHKAMREMWDSRAEQPIFIPSGSSECIMVEQFFDSMKDKKAATQTRLLLATGALLSIFGSFFEDKAHLPSSHRARTERIKRVILYIRQNYASNITLDELSGAVGINREYLCREFKAIIGISPINFLIEYRIEQSKKVLLSPRGTVTEAAISSGFSDISYYIKKFTALNGTTPMQFRKARLE